MAVDYGALAEGLQKGFSIGMSFVDMENRKKQQEVENQRAKEELNMRKAEAQNNELLRETGLRLQVIGAIKDPVRQAEAFKKVSSEHGFDIDVGDPVFISGIIKDSLSILATIKKPGTPKKVIEAGREQLIQMMESVSTQEEISALMPAFTSSLDITPEEETSLLVDRTKATEKAKLDIGEDYIKSQVSSIIKKYGTDVGKDVELILRGVQEKMQVPSASDIAVAGEKQTEAKRKWFSDAEGVLRFKTGTIVQFGFVMNTDKEAFYDAAIRHLQKYYDQGVPGVVGAVDAMRDAVNENPDLIPKEKKSSFFQWLGKEKTQSQSAPGNQSAPTQTQTGASKYSEDEVKIAQEALQYETPDRLKNTQYFKDRPGLLESLTNAVKPTPEKQPGKVQTYREWVNKQKGRK